MTLVVEDGSQVEGANSYQSLVDAQALANSLGYEATLSEANLLRSMAVLSALNYCGKRVSASQALPFPRQYVRPSDGRELAADAIPQELINAQMFLAVEINQGNDPTAMQQAAVIREKVDVLETEYKPSTVTSGTTIWDLPMVAQNLKYLVCNDGLTGRIHRA